MKILYTRASDGGVSIFQAVDKSAVEAMIVMKMVDDGNGGMAERPEPRGPMSDQEYEDFIFKKGVPVDAVNPRKITDADVPASREFRNAWCDKTVATSIDIDLVKAKEIQLAKLRKVRDAELAATDGLYTRALEKNDAAAIAELKAKREALRNATEDLKSLSVSGYTDPAVLAAIKAGGSVSKIEDIKAGAVVKG